jgi:thiol-disulfide isomerase/thioredoxin
MTAPAHDRTRRSSKPARFGFATLAGMSVTLLLGAASAPTRPAPGWLDGLEWARGPAIRAEDLRGKVVVVEFWTFDCINCRRTIPAVRALVERFPAGGDVVVLGIHTPELKPERDPRNVRRAIGAHRLSLPVALDPDYRVWRAFDNRYWPAFYVLDRKGSIRATRVGELHVGTPGWEQFLDQIAKLRRERA